MQAWKGELRNDYFSEYERYSVKSKGWDLTKSSVPKRSQGQQSADQNPRGWKPAHTSLTRTDLYSKRRK